jgi:hypothetical protein
MLPAKSVFHEFGHALMYSLEGGIALPSYFFSLPLTERTWPLRLFWSFALGWGFLASRQTPSRLLTLLCALAFLALWGIGLTLSPETQDMLHVAAGPGGEIVLAALVLGAFFCRLPPSWRWDIARFPAAIAAGYSFFGARALWLTSRGDWQELPFGTALGGPDDQGGDINRLIGDYFWSTPAVSSRFLRVWNFSMLVLTLVTIAALIHALSHSRARPLNKSPVKT